MCNIAATQVQIKYRGTAPPKPTIARAETARHAVIDNISLWPRLYGAHFRP